MSGSGKAGYICALRGDACALARPTLNMRRSRLIMQLQGESHLESDASHRCDFAPLFVYQYRVEGTISGDIRVKKDGNAGENKARNFALLSAFWRTFPPYLSNTMTPSVAPLHLTSLQPPPSLLFLSSIILMVGMRI